MPDAANDTAGVGIPLRDSCSVESPSTREERSLPSASDVLTTGEAVEGGDGEGIAVDLLCRQ